MKKVFTLFFISSFLVTGLFLSAQNPFTFTNANSKFASATFKSGNSISVVDMDGDGMDDIARLDGGDDLYYTIQRTGQTFNNIHAVVVGSGDVWAMVVADANNDGKRDVAVGYGSTAKLVMANTTLTNFTLSTLPNSSFFLQNMNFADINNDGWNDIFGCNDNGASRMWGNSGSGTYPATSNYFSTNNPGSSDNSGNYGSIWTDVNNDGHIDLYIAHCRQNTGGTDGNRLDQLFINDGNNNYVLDGTGVRGLRNYQQTWTSSFEDIDNDGDLDCILTETDAASKLFLNDGNGYFTNITAGSGFTLDVTPYQSKMEDLDNDGYVDIVISGDDSRVFRNNHNNTFTLINNLFDGNDMLSFATGDLNHDGKIDLYSSYGSPYNNPSGSINDVLWMNATDNGNHFITFNLQGTQSNRDALGARVEIYGAWGKQIREVRAGESYGTTNSFMCHFGLGTATMIDSAIVRWPRGQVSRLYSRPADQFITVIEGQCSSPDNIIAFNGPSALCAGQSVTLSAPAGYSYLWNTGAITQTVSTSATGDFTVKVTDNTSGCSSISRMATIVSQPNETPTISAAGPTTFCEGVGVILNGSFAAGGYLWSNGETTQNINATQPGTYTLTIHGVCADFTSQAITVSPITSHVSNVVDATTCQGNAVPVTLQAAVTGDAYWYDAVTGGNVLGTGTSYTTPSLTNTTTYYVESRDTVPGLSGFVGPATNVFGTGGNFNGSQYQIFSVFKACVLKTVKVYAGSSGNRTVELRNSAGTLLTSATINIPSGESTITLNFSIAPGTAYRLGWSGSTANLYRNNAGASYPYTIASLISVTGSSAGSGYWYSYYNWQVEEQPIACASIRVPVTATVNPLPSATIIPNGAISFCDGGSVMLTADLNTSYLWSDNSTSQSVTADQSGNYSVTVTSADNCSNSASIIVTEFAVPDATITTDKPTSICTGDNVTLTAAAGLNYNWSDNSTLQSITVSSNGIFTVTVTDNNSCSAESIAIEVTVSDNAVAGITPSGVTTFCEGGSVQLTASAGTSYLWSNNETTADITVNASGTFTVTVTGVGTCVAISDPFNVVVNPNPSTPTITPSGSTTFCEGGTVDLSSSASGGYLWSNGSTLPGITVTESGNYSVEITDVNGCSAASLPTLVTVNPNPAVPTITPSGSTTFCEGGTVDLSSSVSDSYLWSNGSTLPSITVTQGGNYSVEVTGVNGCSTASLPTTVIVNLNPSAPTIIPSGSTTFCEGGTVDLSAGVAESYSWSNGSTLPSITVSLSGSYSVEVTDVNGCSAVSSSALVTVNLNPVVSMSGLNSQYFNTDAAVTLSGTPSGGSFSGTGVTGSIFDPAVAGVGGPYTITYNYTDGNGCSASASSDVTVELGSAVHQIEGISAVNIFPNPSEGQFLLTLKSGGMKKFDIAISNYIGEKIFEEKHISASSAFVKQISLKDVARGFYNLTITSGKKQNTYKLVVQ